MAAMSRIFLLAALTGLAPAFGYQDPPSAAPQARAVLDGRSSQADYVIHARLDESKLLEGEMVLTWTNNSGEAVDELWFHLHLNAYSNTLSSHLYESKGRLRGHSIKAGFSYQEVTSLSVDGADVFPTLSVQHPDDEREEDRTVFSVSLPQPLVAGATAKVELEWTSQLPRVRRRTGYHKDFLLVSHWFPKLGVFEAGEGWNCHQFHMNTEFYADYGTYDVTLDLPGKYAVLENESKSIVFKGAATGAMVGVPIVEDGRVEVRFQAPSAETREYEDPVTHSGGTKLKPLVHGFAWTADPDYVVFHKRFEFAEWAELHNEEVQAVAIAFERPLEEISLRSVDVTVLVQPEHADQAERYYEATCAALFFYGLWWGEYPYEHITCVDPAWGARGAGGMEYPLLFTGGTRMLTSEAMHTPEGVTVHEAGHQFWYGLVGNNEYEAAWMDEGFNSYTDSEVMFRHYGPSRAASSYSGLSVWGTTPAPAPSMEDYKFNLGPLLAGMLGKDAPSWLSSLRLEPLNLSPFTSWWRDQPGLCFVEQYSDPRWGDRRGYLGSPAVDPLQTVAFEHMNRSSYSSNSYPRTAAALRTLSGVVGRDAFLRGMRGYAERWRYRHPYPEDFYAAFNEFSGTDVSWYFEDVFQGDATVDWTVSVSQDTEPKGKGLFRIDGEWVDAATRDADADTDTDNEPEAEAEPATESAAESEAEPAIDPAAEPAAEPAIDPAAESAAEPAAESAINPEAEPEEAAEPKPSPARRYDVVISRRGNLRLPLTIEVLFDDEHLETFTWTRAAQAEQQWWRLPLEPRDAKIISVVADPERLYYLEANMSDNQWYAQPDRLAPLRWSERVFTRYAHLLHWVSTLGG
ncbi:MAG: hypothetical protein ACI8QC_003002 [Planctomycetota bacterium]|jgi:hypothetical protein